MSKGPEVSGSLGHVEELGRGGEGKVYKGQQRLNNTEHHPERRASAYSSRGRVSMKIVTAFLYKKFVHKCS